MFGVAREFLRTEDCLGEKKTVLDRLVDSIGDLMNSAGLNGTRLKWRWQNRRRLRGERWAESEMRFRMVTARHKMCPSCRSLVPSGASSCSECGASIAHVSGPGPARILESQAGP